MKTMHSDAMAPFARAIARALDDDGREPEILGHLFWMWANSIARFCIGLRQRGTGGAFLLTPKPVKQKLQVGHPFAYPRLRDSAILCVLDKQYSWRVEHAQHELTTKNDPVPADLVREVSLAETDAQDREDEITGAVKLIASLAAVDALVLMTPALSVAGFGVKIGSTANVTTVYDGAGFAHRGTRARKIDLSQFGTRHGSMLRYCAEDRKALGIVVSQDGYVRLITTVRNSLVLWNNPKLLGYRNFSRQLVLREKTRRESRSRHGWRFVDLGYTNMPKTIDLLIRPRASRRKETISSRSGTQRRSGRPPSRSPRKPTNVRSK
jgi:hypothetical protein